MEQKKVEQAKPQKPAVAPKPAAQQKAPVVQPPKPKIEPQRKS